MTRNVQAGEQHGGGELEPHSTCTQRRHWQTRDMWPHWEAGDDFFVPLPQLLL